jgi:hypothetical protein
VAINSLLALVVKSEKSKCARCEARGRRGLGFLALDKIQNPPAPAVNTIDEIGIVIAIVLILWLVRGK